MTARVFIFPKNFSGETTPKPVKDAPKTSGRQEYLSQKDIARILGLIEEVRSVSAEKAMKAIVKLEMGGLFQYPECKREYAAALEERLKAAVRLTDADLEPSAQAFHRGLGEVAVAALNALPLLGTDEAWALLDRNWRFKSTRLKEELQMGRGMFVHLKLFDVVHGAVSPYKEMEAGQSALRFIVKVDFSSSKYAGLETTVLRALEGRLEQVGDTLDPDWVKLAASVLDALGAIKTKRAGEILGKDWQFKSPSLEAKLSEARHVHSELNSSGSPGR